MRYKLPEKEENAALGALPPMNYGDFLKIKKEVWSIWEKQTRHGLDFTLSQLWYILAGLVESGMDPARCSSEMIDAMNSCDGYRSFMAKIEVMK
jgi:hypothetical protein